MDLEIPGPGNFRLRRKGTPSRPYIHFTYPPRDVPEQLVCGAGREIWEKLKVGDLREPGEQALTGAVLGRTCSKGEAPASTASERASAALGRRSAGLHIYERAVSYSDLSKAKTRCARLDISACFTEGMLSTQGLRRRAERRRAERRRAERRLRAAVLSGPARHGSRSGSTSCT